MIWMAQCLCPQRHAIMACFADGPDAHEPATAGILERALRGTVAAAIGKQMLNPWCGICKAAQDSWTYEAAVTGYRTMEDAAEAIALQARVNLEANAVLSDSPILRHSRN